MGIDYGPDGIRGTADDIIYKAGQPAETPVDEIDANIDLSYFAGLDTPTPPPGLTHQQQIDWSANFAAANHFDSGVIIGSLSLFADDQTTLLTQGHVTFNAVPESTAFDFLAVSTLAGAALLRRRK